MNSSRSGWVLAISLGLVLAVFPLRFARYTANLDVYLQLIMAEGFLNGTGYGYYDNGEFVTMGSRPASARWPPGISMLAAGLSALRLDPLVAMIWIYPLLIVLCYGIILYALKAYCPLPAASVIAFGAMTPVVVLDSFTRLNSEVYALLAMAVLFLIVVNGPRKGRNGVFQAGVWLTIASVVLTMMRFAGVYLVASACLLFAALWLRGVRDRIVFIVSVGAASAAPLVALLLYLGPSPPDPTAGQEVSAASAAYWEAPFPVWVAREWFGHLKMLAEAAIPRIGPVFRKTLVPTAIGGAVVGLVLFSLLRREEKGSLHRICLAASGMVFGYLTLLAITAAYFRMPWSLIYRVSGFIQPLAIIGLSTALLLVTGSRYRTACIGIVLAVALARYGHSWRYQSLVAASNVLSHDYRQTVLETEAVLKQKFPLVDTVLVRTSHPVSRHLLRQLWYSERFRAKLPWKVVPAEKMGIQMDRPDQLPPSSVLIVYEEDFHQLSGTTRESLSSGRVKAFRFYQYFILGQPT